MSRAKPGEIGGIETDRASIGSRRAARCAGVHTE